MEWSLFVLIIKLVVHCSAQDVQLLKFTIMRDTRPEGGGDLVCSGGILNIELNKKYKIRIDYPAYSTVYKQARWGLQNFNMQYIIMYTGKSYYAESALFTALAIGSFSYKGVFFTNVCVNIQYGICNYKQGTSMYPDYGVTCQATINVLNPGETSQNVEITPREAVRRAGDQLEVLCRVAYDIDSCRMSVGATTYRLKPGDTEGDVVYHGQGLQNGECGALIRNIREEWNGNVTCVLPPQSGSIEIQTSMMHLLVEKAPKQPVLLAPPQPAFKEGDVFSAQCVAADGRPAAKISWFLNDKKLLTGVHQPIVTSEPGSDLQTISQNVSRPLMADDSGSSLVCRLEHEALPSPYDIQRQIIVNYPPKRQESGPITIFGLKLNEAGRLNVSVRANPPPRVSWSTDGYHLTAPQSSEDGLMSAPQPMHLGGGYYNVTLILSRVTKEEVERSYYLELANDLGSEKVTVRISTMDEPADSPWLVASIVAVMVSAGGAMLVLCCYCRRKHVAAIQAPQSPAMVAPSRSLWRNWTLFRSVRINTERTGEEAEITKTTSANYDYAYVSNVKRLVVRPHDNVESSDYDYISIHG